MANLTLQDEKRRFETLMTGRFTKGQPVDGREEIVETDYRQQLEEIRNDVARMEAEKQQMQQQLQDVNEELSRLSAAAVRTKENAEMLETRNIELEAQLERASGQAVNDEIAGGRIQELQSQVERLTNEKNNAINECAESRRRIEEAHVEVSSARHESGARLSAITEERNILVEKVGALECKISDADKRALDIEKEMVSAAAVSRSEKDGLLASSAKLEQLISELQVRIRNQEEQILNAEDVERGRAMELGETSSERNSLKGRLENLESESRPMREKLKTWEVLIHELEKQIEQRDSAIEALKRNGGDETNELTEKISGLEHENAGLKAKVCSMEEEAGRLRELHKINGGLLQEKVAFERQVGELNALLKSKEQEKTFDTNNARKLAGLVAKLREQLQTVRNSQRQVEEQLWRSQTENDAKIQSLILEKTELSGNLAAAHAALAKTQSQLDEKQRQISSLTTKIDSITSENIELEFAFGELGREKDALVREKQKFEERLKALSELLKTNEFERASVVEANKSLEQQIENLRTATTELSTADKQVIDGLQKKIEENLGNIESLELEKGDLVAQLSNGKKRIEEVETRLAEKEKNITDLNDRIVAAKSEIEDLQKAIFALQSEKQEMENRKAEVEVDVRKIEAAAAVIDERKVAAEKSDVALKKLKKGVGQYTKDVDALNLDIKQQLEATLLENAKRIKQIQDELEEAKKRKETTVQIHVAQELLVDKTEEVIVSVKHEDISKGEEKGDNKRTNRRVLAAKATATAYKNSALGILRIASNFAVEMRDISVSGAALYVTQKLQPQDKIIVQILDNSFKERLRLSAEVVWCKLFRHNLYACGVSFTKMTRKDAEILAAIVKYYSDPSVIARLQSSAN